MAGRYGVDDLSRFLLYVAVGLMLVNMVVRNGALNTLAAALLVYVYFRMFSRNIQGRYAENQKFLGWKNRFLGFFRKRIARMKDLRTHHIYSCPSCHQKIRVPRGKGKIVVTCPKCRTEFEKKS